MTRTIAIANQKGGVGKTTTAVSLAAALAELDQRVLGIDLDPQGHFSINMGLRIPDELDLSVYNILVDHDVRVTDVIMHTDEIDLDYLPANVELAAAELHLVNEFGREMILRDKLEQVAGNYDFIVIDCPPSLGLLCINAFVAATEIIIPLQCEYFGMKGMLQLQRSIDKVKAKLNPELRIAGILPTIYKPRTLHSQEVLELVRDHYGSLVYNITVDSSIRFAETTIVGKSILQYANTSPGAKAYRALAKAVLANIPDVPLHEGALLEHSQAR